MRLLKVSALAVCLLTAFSSLTVALDQPSTTVAPFEKYLPESTMMFFSITDLGEFKAVFNDPKLQKIFEISGIGGRMAEFHRNFTEEFYNETGMKPSAIFDALTGDVTLAVLDSDFTEIPKVVLFAKVDPERFPYRQLVDLATEKEGAKEVVIHEIGGVTVTEIVDETSFALSGDHIFFASSVDAMKQILAPEKPLTGSPLYLRHREMTKLSGGLIGYVNVAMFLERLKPFLPDPETGEGREVELLIDLLGLRRITSASAMIPLRENEPLRLFIHAPGYDGILTKVFTGEPVDLNCAGYVPADFDSFFAFSIRKPLDIFNTVLEMVEEFNPGMRAADFDDVVKPYEDAVGISIKGDLLAPLGTTIGAGVKLNTDAELNLFAGPEEIFNFFRFELFFSLDDPDRFLAALQTLAGTSNDMVSVDTYKGATLFISHPPMLPYSVDIAIHGNLILFCLGTDLIKQAIDAVETGDSLYATGEFKDRTARVPKNAWYIAFNSDSYLKKFFSGFFRQMIVMKEGSEERASEIIGAVLDYAGDRTGGVAFSTATPEGLFVESSASMRAAIAIIPIYFSWFATESFEHDTDFEQEDEEDYEGAEPPHLHPQLR